jgi:hypothetical protein
MFKNLIIWLLTISNFNILSISSISSALYLPASNNNHNVKLLFFTGGNALMPADIYSDFIRKLENKYEVYTIKNSNKDATVVIEQLLEYSSQEEIVPIGHSSGCTTLLNYCTKLKNTNKCILLDPVNNNLNEEVIKRIRKTNNIQTILQINAEKSYKWKFGNEENNKENKDYTENKDNTESKDNTENKYYNLIESVSSVSNKVQFPSIPIFPKMPFIPAFAMNVNEIFNNDVLLTKINVNDFGHCDILDTAFSNIMHNSFAEGNNNRMLLNDYKNLLIDIIDTYINSNGNETFIEYLNDKNGKYNIDYIVEKN